MNLRITYIFELDLNIEPTILCGHNKKADIFYYDCFIKVLNNNRSVTTKKSSNAILGFVDLSK